MTESTKFTAENIPELYVEKLVLGELDDAAQNALRERLTKAEMQDRINKVQKSNEEILSEYTPAQLAASIRLRYEMSQEARHKKRLMVWLPVSAAIGAAAVFLFMVLPAGVEVTSGNQPGTVPVSPTYSGSEGYIGYKGNDAPGDARLNLGKKTVDGQEWIKTGELLNEGDEVQIKFHSGNAKSLVICSVDGRGAVSLHYPENESDSTTVKSMDEHVLPFAYTLDDAPDFERFILVWSESDTPVSVSEVLNAVKQMSDAKNDTPRLNKSLKFKDFTVTK